MMQFEKLNLRFTGTKGTARRYDDRYFALIAKLQAYNDIEPGFLPFESHALRLNVLIYRYCEKWSCDSNFGNSSGDDQWRFLSCRTNRRNE